MVLNEIAKWTRDRLGLVAAGTKTTEIIDKIVAAEMAGITQIWMTQPTSLYETMYETLGVYAAAAVKTSTIRLGTSIMPTYPRHPLVLAQEAMVVHELSGGRLRLGIGPSHLSVISGIYGLPMSKPLAHLREYVGILRSVLWNGNADHQGEFYNVHVKISHTTQIPILISALGTRAYKMAGEISDGAISWMCPVPYLLAKALPALRKGAKEAGRAVPPLIAHIPIVLSEDRQVVINTTRAQVGRYGRRPYYANMFAEAGFPVSDDGELTDDLIDNLVVFGDDETILSRLNSLLTSEIDELLIMPLTVADANQELHHIRSLLMSLAN